MSRNLERNQTSQPRSDYYEIRVEEHLAPQWLELFEGVAITHIDSGETVLAGFFEDQSALHGLLARIRDLNLTLISVNRVENEALREEIFEEYPIKAKKEEQ